MKRWFLDCRFRAQLIRAQATQVWGFFWEQSPGLLLMSSVVVPLTGIILVKTLMLIGPILCWALLGYGLFLALVGLARMIDGVAR